jgi:hypothetical protein
MDAGAFFAEWRKQFGPLSQGAVDGINALIAEMEARGWEPRWFAYGMATAYWETGRTMRPIEEYGKGSGRVYAVPDATGRRWFGRGFVQLTWRENYEKLGEALGFDLVGNPDMALDPTIAAAILCEGMEHARFTKFGLGDFFDHDSDDPIGARRIVNGTDKAKEIAAIYRKALAAVKAGLKPMSHKPPLVDQPTDMPSRKVSAGIIAGSVLTYVLHNQAELAGAIPGIGPFLGLAVALGPVLPSVFSYFVRDRL